MVIEEKIKELGLYWPKQSPKPMANYVSLRRSGVLLFLSGAGPFIDGEARYVGKVGEELSVQEAYEAARISAVNLLSTIHAEVGSLEKIRVLKLLGFVNSANDFFQQPEVINGASDLIVEILGDNGKHARTAIGTNVLPFNIPVEIELIAELLE
ncbi:RidA family protein [Bacillus sp. S/N-304-OC-R1]|uniref:RidA family protein n=1 Tax=Bacillus sp. S/N-304-OC-R1 TaxID=2758034 RepID=UPI001C8DE951|nr:RidA family protein [Bacillus sp. S/N-304-OC-R1]MBY0121687.1 RidA family protein [Bacillus sp. S/N-304-OC-R1]